jgi:SAM-dependent methyltransferase
VVATDLFSGMLQTIAEAAAALDLTVETLLADLQAFPFARDGFDLVFANHVLYHLPDIDQGVRELARVTRPAGTLVATTNADDTPVAVIDLHRAALDRLGAPADPEPPSAFSLRNGEAVLRKSFADVRLHVFRDEQVYPAPRPWLRCTAQPGDSTPPATSPGSTRPTWPRPPSRWRHPGASCAARSLTSPIVMGSFICTGA